MAGEQNAAINQLTIATNRDIMTLENVAVITVADVFYHRDNLALLLPLQRRCTTLLVADSRRKGSALSSLSIIGEFNSHTVLDLDESKEFNHVFIYSNQTGCSKFNNPIQA